MNLYILILENILYSRSIAHATVRNTTELQVSTTTTIFRINFILIRVHINTAVSNGRLVHCSRHDYMSLKRYIGNPSHADRMGGAEAPIRLFVSFLFFILLFVYFLSFISFVCYYEFSFLSVFLYFILFLFFLFCLFILSFFLYLHRSSYLFVFFIFPFTIYLTFMSISCIIYYFLSCFFLVSFFHIVLLYTRDVQFSSFFLREYLFSFIKYVFPE